MAKKFGLIRAFALALGSMVMAAGLVAPAASAAESRIAGAPVYCKIRIVSMASGLTVRVKGTTLHADSAGTGAAEEFWVQHYDNGVVYLQSNANGNYVEILDSTRRLYAEYPDKKINGQWRWEDVSPGARTFRLIGSPGNYARVEPSGDGLLRSDNQNRDNWSLFGYDVVFCL
ncbi:fascin domain-containing protein [Amycolatopsis pittospori]|uniref:fascin domain-containing protein n=1 Tax=Amycolatopsis pittospori TaxID=2749434 RepID=UPI0015F05CC6|nr:hypothetical protein [Amycolatopsis pittospori]